ncbi:MAG: hypothetical protein HY897_04590 [Deltaproteobacteria bacterium]|nr:hypothetical protein [Deltaproteobacteria bacterium]
MLDLPARFHLALAEHWTEFTRREARFGSALAFSLLSEPEKGEEVVTSRTDV